MIRTLIIIASLVVSGCASHDDRFTSPQNRAVVVRWITVDDVDQYCRDLGAKALPYPVIEVYGCATYTKTKCTIYTSHTTTNAIVGHELRHCFDGNYHD